MSILLTSLALVATSLGFHICWWRIHRPTMAVRALCVLFTVVAVVWLAANQFVSARAGGITSGAVRSVWDVIYVLTLYFSICLVYLITYIGIEAESPSVLVLFAVHRAGHAGLKRTDFAHVVSNEEMIDRRLLDMTRARILKHRGDKYSITRYGKTYLAFYMLPRQLMGLSRKGG